MSLPTYPCPVCGAPMRRTGLLHWKDVTVVVVAAFSCGSCNRDVYVQLRDDEPELPYPRRPRS